MICPTCQRTVPDESVFCLSCGTRLLRTERRVSGNGGAATVQAPGVGTRVTAGPSTKQAYALSFRPLANDRLRYRVARWVCEIAPAHQFAEVQEGLLRGDFVTFLALTTEEAQTMQQRVRALGVHAATMHLAPAFEAEITPPTRSANAESGSGWSSSQKLMVAAIVLIALLLFGLLFRFKFG